MLLPRLKLARLFDRAFHAMADLHWTVLFALILAHAGLTWILLALAEAAEQLSVGLALAGELTSAGIGRGRALFIVSALGMLVFVSAVLGATVLSTLTGGAMEAVLSFGAAALLFLVTEELLREAHEERESALGTAMFFLGFLAFLVIGMTLD